MQHGASRNYEGSGQKGLLSRCERAVQNFEAFVIV